MNKYYLLVFNEDFADEHNVPALACMNEDDYQTWLQSSVSRPNAKYEEELAEYNSDREKYENYLKEGKKIYDELGIKAYREYLSKNYVSSVLRKPKKGYSLIYAHLGNNGGEFGEMFDDYITGKDLVDDNTVKVTEVPEIFYTIFHENKLHDLSLTNVFNIDPDFDIEDYD